jgi:hypothetical protein
MDFVAGRCLFSALKNNDPNGGYMDTSVLPQSKWKAWYDRMPPGPATLHVTGEHTFPTAGYSAELKPAAPQGFNPKIYILDLIVHEPKDPVILVPEVVKIEYHEETNVIYDEVSIRADSVVLENIPVEQVW